MECCNVLVRFTFLTLLLMSMSVDSNSRRDAKGSKSGGNRPAKSGGVGGGSKKGRNQKSTAAVCRQLSCCGCGGVSGPPGPTGIQGIQGVQGIQGPAGQPGFPGVHGNKGQKGDRGFKGDPGVPGKTVFTPLPERPQVAFSVTMDEDMPRAVKYRVVKFSIVLSNLGGAYDAENGIFNTPINGTYVVGFSGVSYHGQDMLLHLIKNGQRILSAFDNSGCGCCSATNAKCAGSGSNVGILTLVDGDQLWIELPDEHGIHNAPYHNYASFYGYLLYPKSFGYH